jgi:hypothetical protein
MDLSGLQSTYKTAQAKFTKEVGEASAVKEKLNGLESSHVNYSKVAKSAKDNFEIKNSELNSKLNEFNSFGDFESRDEEYLDLDTIQYQQKKNEFNTKKQQLSDEIAQLSKNAAELNSLVLSTQQDADKVDNERTQASIDYQKEQGESDAAKIERDNAKAELDKQTEVETKKLGAEKAEEVKESKKAEEVEKVEETKDVKETEGPKKADDVGQAQPEVDKEMAEALNNYKKLYGKDVDPNSREFGLYLSVTYGNAGYEDNTSASDLTWRSSFGFGGTYKNGKLESQVDENGKVVTSKYKFNDVANVIRNGGTPQEAAALEQEILKNGSDEEIQQYIQSALDTGGGLYDHNKNHDAAADDRADMINKYATTKQGGYVKNNICGPIHGSMMEALQEAGYNAELIAGNNAGLSGEIGGGHYTLMYQNKSGDYVFCNYGISIVVEADNSEQAKKIAMREGYNFQSSGGFIESRGDNGTNTLTSYLHEQEAAYGENHNVENRNSETAISKSKIDPKSAGLKTDYTELDDIGQKKVTVEGKYVNNDVTFELHGGLQGKTTGKTDNFYSSESIGLNAGFTKLFQNGLTLDGDATTTYTNGKIATTDHDYLALSGEVGLGYKKNVVDNDNVSLDIAARTSAKGGMGLTDFNTKTAASQARTTAEVGFDTNIKPNDNITFNMNGNAGIIGDFVLGSYDKQNNTISPALKLNGGVNTQIQGESWNVNAFGNVDYTNAFNGTFTTLDYEAGLDFTKEVGDDKSLTFGGKVSSKTKDVRIGGFDERLKNEKTVTGELSYTSGNNTISGALDINPEDTKKSNATLSFKHKF